FVCFVPLSSIAQSVGLTAYAPSPSTVTPNGARYRKPRSYRQLPIDSSGQTRLREVREGRGEEKERTC
ncbi:MAG: hypothetical protein NT070_23450, partial [Cyanobacteria bacterium]|nr:hypothetical protein [Cyanobacteriota bacterium]